MIFISLKISTAAEVTDKFDGRKWTYMNPTKQPRKLFLQLIYIIFDFFFVQKNTFVGLWIYFSIYVFLCVIFGIKVNISLKSFEWFCCKILIVCLTFQAILTSASKLTRHIDPSQLTVEFGGKLQYSHQQWLDNILSFDVYLNEAKKTIHDLKETNENRTVSEYVCY